MAGYTERKRQRIAQLRRIWLGLVVLTMLGGAALLYHLLPTDSWLLITKRGDAAQKQGAALGLAEFVPLLAMLGTAGTAVIAAWKFRSHVARFVFERCCDVFHDQLFEPVRRPAQTADGKEPLPWLQPKPGQAAPERIALWDNLDAWLQRGSRLDAPDAEPVAWAVLVGRPGAGKSRTADEFGRAMARRELFGDLAARSWRQRLAVQRLRLGAWWRRARRKPRAGDPWDVGRPAHRSTSGTALLHQSVGYQRWLAQWRPRAPTLILFEDPRADEAAHLIQWLAARAVPGGDDATELPFHFPVRILIVNQSLPLDLQFFRTQEQPARWASQLPAMTAGPWVVNEGAYFTWAEWVELKRRCFAPDDLRAFIDRAQFGTLTRDGNPLLVESLVHWLHGQAAGKRPHWEQVTPEELLRDRARRVAQALTTAQLVGHGHWTTLAAATVLGGMPREAAGQTMDAAALQRVFPDEDVQRRIPGVRPDLVGLAFVDLVLDEPAEAGVIGPADATAQRATAAAIARIAWRADAHGVLAAMIRQAQAHTEARAALGVGRRDLLWAALSVPPDDLAVDPASLALAFVRFQLVHGGAMEQALTRVRALAPAAALSIAVDHVCATLVLSGARARDALTLFAVAMERALQAEPVEAHTVDALVTAAVALSKAVRRCGELLPQPQEPAAPGFRQLGRHMARWARQDGGAADPQRSARVTACLRALWHANAMRVNVLAACAAGVLEVEDALPGRSLLALELDCMVSALSGDTQATDNAARQLASERLQLADPVQASLAVAAWMYAACTHALSLQTDSAQRAQAGAEAIAAIRAGLGPLPLAERTTLAEWHVTALGHVAYVHCKSARPDSVAQASACVEAIARVRTSLSELPPAECLELAERHAGAWAFVAHAHVLAGQADAPEQARACADAIARIRAPMAALPIADQLDLAVRQVETWLQITSAYSRSTRPDSALQAQAGADAIGALREPFRELSVAERRELAEAHGRALVLVGGVHAQARLADSALQARASADAIASMRASLGGLPLAEGRTLAHQHALAWAHVATAHKLARQPDAGARIRECADAIERICAAFSPLPVAERRGLAEAHADAWACAAYVLSVSGQPGAPRRAMECADAIAHIGAPFSALALPARRELAERHAQALACAAYAYRLDDAADSAVRAVQCAQAIEQVRQPFSALPVAERVRLAEHQAEAWACAAYAHGVARQPDGGTQAEACAEAITSIVAACVLLPLSERSMLDRWHSHAWRHAARAFQQRSDTSAAARCVGRVREIAQPWLASQEWAREDTRLVAAFA